MNNKTLPRHLTGAFACAALALTITAAPIAVGIPDMDGAAYAKGGNGGGNGGGKGGGNGGGKGAEKSKSSKAKKGGKSKGTSSVRRGGGDPVDAIRGLFGKKPKTTRSASKRKTQSATTETVEGVETDEVIALTPNQKGRWNAANANQNALDAHIRNENFNGTIGALAYYQLAGKAASGADLTEDEQAALDNLLGDYGPTITDDDLAALLNSEDPDAPVWDVTNGVATCTDNCDQADVDAANQDLADYIEDQNMDAEGQAIDDLWADAQQRIIDDSNKPTEGIEDQLLDEIAHQLGFDRMDTAEDDPEAVDPEEIDPDEITLLPEDGEAVETASN